MDLVLEVLITVMFILIIVKIVAPALLVGYVLNQASEISVQEYKEVADLLKKDPRLKPFVDKALKDNIISKEEYESIKAEPSKLDLR